MTYNAVEIYLLFTMVIIGGVDSHFSMFYVLKMRLDLINEIFRLYDRSFQEDLGEI